MTIHLAELFDFKSPIETLSIERTSTTLIFYYYIFFLYSINNKYVTLFAKKILKFIRNLLDETLREINEIYARINFPKQKGKQAMQVKKSTRQRKRRYIILSAYSCVRALNLCCRPLHTINGTGTVIILGRALALES